MLRHIDVLIGLESAMADRVDPKIGRGPEQVCARICDSAHIAVKIAAADRRKSPQQRLLNEILSLPHVAAHAAAIAIEPGTDGLDSIKVAKPCGSHLFG